MKVNSIKMKHVLPVLAVAFTCMFSLSSCFTILSAIIGSKDKRTDAQKTYDQYGYHFTAEAPSGQMLCFRYLDSLNVSCVTPPNFQDPATGISTSYKLTGDVVIPKTVSNGGKTYNVTELGVTNLIMSDGYGGTKKVNAPWGSKDITNLVIPPTIKKIKELKLEFYGFESKMQNIIDYSSEMNTDRYTFDNIYGKNTWLHVPSDEVYYANIKNDSRIVKIVDDYDIYEEGHSLDEYLKMAQLAIDQKRMIKEFLDSRASCPIDRYPDFVVVDNQNIKYYYHIMDKDKKEVHLCGTRFESDATEFYGYSQWSFFTVPSRVTYQGVTYTVTSATVDSKVVAIPETCKLYEPSPNSGKTEEIICYSSDVEFVGNQTDILHVPHGCVEKYIGKARTGCLEIVDNYSVYEKGHSIKEYYNMSRDAVEKVKAAKEKAIKDAELKQQQKEEAELKAVIAELNKKYGKKYVDAILRGELAVGMPEELFAIGINKNMFNRITRVSLDHESAGSKCYKMYGYGSSETSTRITLSSSKYIGRVWIRNGKISSIDWL